MSRAALTMLLAMLPALAAGAPAAAGALSPHLDPGMLPAMFFRKCILEAIDRCQDFILLLCW